MAGFRVIDIERNKPDSAGAIVCDIYFKIEKIFAVYRTEDRVMIQFADEQELGSQQRQSLIDLYLLRGKINSLLDELRDSQKSWRKFNSIRYVRSLADALVVAMQGQTAQAKVDLENLHAALVGERSSRIRLAYLLNATLSTAAMAILIYIIYSHVSIAKSYETAQSFWYSAAVGMVGAFTSVVFMISKRELDTEKPWLDMAGDAVLRIFIGIITAVLLMAFIFSELISIKIGDTEFFSKDMMVFSPENWPKILLAAFFAGWSQNLLPELFTKIKVVEGTAPPPSAPATGRADERNPMGNAATPAAPTASRAGTTTTAEDTDPTANDSDTCDDHCHDGGPVTEDVELPEAVGGVEGRD